MATGGCAAEPGGLSEGGAWSGYEIVDGYGVLDTVVLGDSVFDLDDSGRYVSDSQDAAAGSGGQIVYEAESDSMLVGGACCGDGVNEASSVDYSADYVLYVSIVVSWSEGEFVVLIAM